MITIDTLSSSSKGNAYIVSDGVTSLLLEAGIPWKDIQKKSGFKKIDGCLISHEHQDHSKSANDILKTGMEVCMSRGTAKALGIERHNLKWCLPMVPFEIGSWFVKPFDVEHDAAEPLGYMLYSNTDKKLIVFISDSFYCKYIFPGPNIFMLECNYSKDILDANVASGKVDASLRNRIVKSHMSLETVKDMLKANDLSKTEAIYLLHLSDTNSDEERFKREIQELTGKVVHVC